MKTMRGKLIPVALAGAAIAVLSIPTAAQANEPVLTFGSTSVSLTIPTPNCRAAGCTWELYVNEPFVSGQPAVGSVFGTEGTLTIDYPKFCGTIQADILVGDNGVFHKFVGHRTEIQTCPTTTTTTPTTAPSTTTTTEPTTTTTTPTPATPVSSPPSDSPPPPSSGVPTLTPPASAPPVGGTTSPSIAPSTPSSHSPATVPTSLPRTGANVPLLLALGLALVAAGLMLLRPRRVRA